MIVALRKCSKHSLTFLEPSLTLKIPVRPTESSSYNGSATESEVDSLGFPSQGYSIGESIFVAQYPKIVVGKNVEKLTFFTDAQSPLFIVVYKVTLVMRGL